MKSLILFSIMTLGLCGIFELKTLPLDDFSTENQKNINIVLKNNTETIDESENVLSYVDVLNTYYELAIGDSINPTITFDEFYDKYYAEDSDRNLYEFTLNLAKDNGNYENVSSLLYGETSYESTIINNSDVYEARSLSSKDEDYIFKNSYDYSSTPSSAFARQPYYSVYDYSTLKNGDIVYETETELIFFGHNALIVDTDHNSAYGTYIQTIEAVGGRVQRGFLDDLRMTKFKCEILRVKGRTNTKANNAIYFATKQIGKPYSPNITRLNTSINASTWYCSELVYACWKYAGIDIGIRNGNYLSSGCLPSDISNSDNTYEISIPYYDFLTFKIISKSGSTWNIKITNTCSTSLSIEYNSKMCFKNDAKNWVGLSDEDSKTINANSFINVQITENWWATTIVASYVRGEYRYISYADNLDKENKTLTEYQSVIRIVKNDEAS